MLCVCLVLYVSLHLSVVCVCENIWKRSQVCVCVCLCTICVSAHINTMCVYLCVTYILSLSQEVQ